MPIKLLSANPPAGKEGAEITVNFFATTKVIHQLKLHQDADGRWWPELKFNAGMCAAKNIQELRDALTEALHCAAAMIQSEDFKDLHTVAKMVSI